MKLIPRRLKLTRIKPKKFKTKWDDVQKFCKNKETWPVAIMNADKLLDEALIKRKFKGKTMGERLVSAQNHLTNNDGVWSAHNYSKKIASEAITKFKESDVKKSLVDFRQALRDLGALK
ncbi:hypothetical protein KC946_02580 [Candidatus Saccharibacteria bacterium]|nr:hypothetical protein [Candidatus Saccharibacteria bacterium]